MKRILYSIVALCFVATIFCCTEKESNIGMGLQDPASLYNGKHDTVGVTAFTFHEDSLRTSGYNSAVIGNYNDAIFGTVNAYYFTQITRSTGIEMDYHSTIDSIVVSLVVSDLYPTLTDSNVLHIQVDQLQEALLTDSAYYAFQNLSVGQRLFDYDVVLRRADTMMVRMKLDETSHALFANKTLSGEDLAKETKGLRIYLNTPNTMATINLAAANTKMTLYYRYDDTISRSIDFAIGTGGTHFCHFEHLLSPAPLDGIYANPQDSLPGTQYLYLEPFGGTGLKVNMQPWIDTFRVAHPNAVINYAVLRLPIAIDKSDNHHPVKLQTYTRTASGTLIGIPDMMDAYTYAGYDGTNQIDSSCYRIRITQHLQQMLISGKDNGTFIYLDSRRSNPRRVVLNGTAAVKPIHFEVVYSE